MGPLEIAMLNAFPGTDLRATPHIESKIKMWKHTYGTVSSMLKTSEFGLHDTDKTIEDKTEDIWEAYLKV